jgi:DNA ligase (NAD+)
VAKKKARPKAALSSPRVAGRTFVFTGTLAYWTREKAARMVRSRGGRVTETVGPSLDVLVVGETPGDRLTAAEKKAEKLNTKGGARIEVVEQGAFYS